MNTQEKFDYRVELQGLLAERQVRNASYSIRALARDLDVSVTALHGVLKGERHFSKKNLEALALRLGWSPQKLDSITGSLKILPSDSQAVIDEDRFKMIADWVHLAILNLAKFNELKVNGVAKRLGVKKEICDEAIERLVRLGFIEVKNEKLIRLEPNFRTTQEIPSQAIRAFHYKNLKKAQEALEEIPIEERHFLTIAAPSSKKKVQEVKKLIQEFRKRILDALEDSENPEEVYFFNLQLYPITKGVK